ncbi:hypothetical protein HDN1F_02950 [gamma proteobacterium HdN1]|nr:hypothetical protein HDN1F_02950 [gamma proteobacterium HdN1]
MALRKEAAILKLLTASQNEGPLMLLQTSVLNEMAAYVRDVSALVRQGYISFNNASDHFWIAQQADLILTQAATMNTEFIHEAACILAGFDDILTAECFSRRSDFERVKQGMDLLAGCYAEVLEARHETRQAA